MIRNHEKIVLASAVVGANVGGYLFVKDDPITKNTLPMWGLGTLIGAGAGSFVAYTAPVVIPLMAVSIPGYLLAKHHSCQQEWQPKAEIQEVQKDLESQTSGAPRESQLR